MEKRKILILAGIFMALLVAVLLLERPKNVKKQVVSSIKVDSQKVDKITINKVNKETVLVKKDGRWVVANQDNLPVDPEAINDILIKLENLTSVRLVSRNPEKAKIFEVDETSGIVVKAEGDGANAHFYIGKNGPDFNSNYIRTKGSDAVYLTNEFIRRSFDRPDFRSWNIFNLKDRRFTRLIYKFPDREIELLREADDSWKQVKNEPYDADKDAVVSLILSLKGLRIDEFVKVADDAVFEEPQLSVSFECEDGYQGSLVVAQKHDENESLIFIKSASSTHQYKISQSKIAKLTEKLKDLAKKPPLPAEEKTGPEKEETGPSSDKF